MTDVEHMGDGRIRVVFEEGFPELGRARAGECVAEWIEILPRWVADLRVFSSIDEKATASINTFERYRFAQLYLHPAWFRATPVDQSEAVLHEFLHAATNPLCELVARVGRAMDVEETSPALHTWIGEALDEARERATQDLTLGIHRALSARGLRG
jgi:hypothetical protein